MATDARSPTSSGLPRWLAATQPWTGLALVVTIAVATVAWGRVRTADERGVLAERRAQVAGYSPAAKNHLARNFERFARLDPAEQTRRVSLEAQLAADPRQVELRETMHRYQDWLKSISSSQRADLRSLPADQRVARIAELRQAQEAELARRQDQRAVAALIEGRLLAHVSDAGLRDKLAAAPEFARRAVLFRQLGPQAMQELRREFTPEELASIARQVSDALQRQLRAAAADETKQRLIAQRLRDVRRQLFEGDGLALLTWMGQEPEPELDRFFKADLTEAQRESLMSLPPDQMRFRLRRLYLHVKFPEVFPDKGSWWDTRGSRDRDRGRTGRQHPGGNRPRPGDQNDGADRPRPGERPGGRPRPGEGPQPGDHPGPPGRPPRGGDDPPQGSPA